MMCTLQQHNKWYAIIYPRTLLIISKQSIISSPSPFFSVQSILPLIMHHLQISEISLSAKGWRLGTGCIWAGDVMCSNARVMMILWPDCLHKLAACPDHTRPVIKWQAGHKTWPKLRGKCSKNNPGPWSSGHFALLNYASGSGELRTWQPSFNT